MPRFTASSASSRGVQCVTGRPDFSGGSQATAKILLVTDRTEPSIMATFTTPPVL